MSHAYGGDGRYDRDEKERLEKEGVKDGKKLTPQQEQVRQGIMAGMTEMMVGQAKMIDAKIKQEATKKKK